MEENRPKLTWKLFFIEILILILGGAGAWFFGSLHHMEQDRLLSACVMTVLGLAVTGFHFRKEYLEDKLDYNNEEHVLRFWLCIAAGLAIAFTCSFLPAAGWPFLVVFVLLSLFSNLGIGILAASMLLSVAVTLSGGTAGDFVLYLICGAFAVTLFRNVESDFRFGVPLFLSILCLLVCETANVVLVANARPNLEMFVVPVVNIILSSILLFGCLKYFSSTVVYQHREKYLDINDTEVPILVELKEKNRQEYMFGVHTAYFCERIAKQLGLDGDALKCASYYHRLGERLGEVMTKAKFPPAAQAILEEYQAGGTQVTIKETAVLICADTVITTISELIQKEPAGKVDYDSVIQSIFEDFWEKGTFSNCSISIGEFCSMRRIFMKEKLYYDFLR